MFHVKLCPSRRVNKHLCPPWSGITKTCHTGASSKSGVFVSFAYFWLDEHFYFSLLNNLGRRSDTGSLWVASSLRCVLYEQQGLFVF